MSETSNAHPCTFPVQFNKIPLRIRATKWLANPELKNKDLEKEQKRSVIKIQIEEKKLEK